MLKLTNKIRRDPRTASRIIDGEAIILTPVDSQIHSLNEVGSKIWESLSKETTVEEIINRITEEFDIDREQARRDVILFLKDMINKGMAEKTK